MSAEDTKTQNIDKHKRDLTESYEYLIVIHVYQTNYASIPNLPDEPDGSRPKQTWTYTWYLTWPDNTKVEERPGNILASTLFNELGKDGWKLITSDIPDSVVVSGGHYGWTEAGIPIRQRFIFMRRRHP
jgi:hypothetical protein